MMKGFFLFLVLIVSFRCFGEKISYDEVIDITDKVLNEQRFIGSLDPLSVQSLPIGIVKEIGAAQYIIAVDSAYFTPQGAFFHAYAAIEFPGTGKKMAFAAKNLRFNPVGVNGGQQSRLLLVSDHRFPVGLHTELHLLPNGNNFVEWNCNGFSGIQLNGEFIFSSDILQNKADPAQPVNARFSVYTEDLQNAITSVSITPFSVKGLNNWYFSVTRAVIDWSTLHNAENMIFPAGYNNAASWTGFWLQEFRVELPQEFSGNGERKSFIANNLIIDDAGISGIFSAQKVFAFGASDLNGWKFSLDDISVRFMENKLQGGCFSGAIHLPVMDSSQRLEFSALIFYNTATEESDYSFSVQPGNNISFSALGAHADIYPGSQIILTKLNHQFKPTAILNGKIRFGNDDFSTGKLDFQQLTIISEPPYVTNGYFSVIAEGNQLGNYPVNIDSVRIVINQQHPQIVFGVALNLKEESNNGIAAHSNIRILTKTNGESSPPIALDRIVIENLMIDVQSQAFNLQGEIAFYNNDPVYGKGFSGELQFSIPKVLEPGFSAHGVFGKTSFNYFAVDAFVPVEIPLGTTPVKINRLMGGLTYHMSGQKNNPFQYINTLYQDPANNTTQQYYPNQQEGFHFKAGAGFSFIPNEKTLNGDALLSVSFSNSGGLEQVQLTGNAYFLSSIEERQIHPAAIYGNTSISYDFTDHIFDAEFQVNAAIKNALQGSGQAKVFIAPDNWQVCLGKPSHPLQINLTGFAAGEGYFMAGKNLEPMMPPPAPLTALVSSLGLNQQRDNNMLENASGFATGFRLGTGLYREFGPDNFHVYGSFGLNAGCDLMMINYGENTSCGTYPAPIGINGWRAEGQLFAYLQCAIGVAGTVAGKDFDLTILQGSVAALLGGKLPKPSWLYGGISCSYSILNVLNGNLQFNFEHGENCIVNE